MKRKETRLVGIVAKTIDYKENDKLATVITKTGAVSIIFKGVKSEKAKLKMATSLFSLVDYSLIECGNGIYQATTASVLATHYSLWTDVKKYSASSILTESVLKVSVEGNELTEEFELLKNLLEIVDESDYNPLIITCYGLYLLFKLEGVDYNDFAIHVKEKDVLVAFSNLSIGDLDSLDVTEATILSLLNTLGRIYHYSFSAKLNSVAETLKLFTSI